MGTISEAVFVFRIHNHILLLHVQNQIRILENRRRGRAPLRHHVQLLCRRPTRDVVERYLPFHALEVNGEACFAGYGVATADDRPGTWKLEQANN